MPHFCGGLLRCSDQVRHVCFHAAACETAQEVGGAFNQDACYKPMGTGTRLAGLFFRSE